MARSIVNAFLVAEAETGLTDCNKPDVIRTIQTAKSRNKAAANHQYSGARLERSCVFSIFAHWTRPYQRVDILGRANETTDIPFGPVLRQ